MEDRPFFRYHPNYYSEMGGCRKDGEKGVCECCGKEVEWYVSHIYSTCRVNCICLECVSNGAAAKKFDCEFNCVRPAEFARDPKEIVSDSSRTDELLHRTPGILSWQEYDWPVCCDDYCIFLGHYDMDPVVELNLSDEDFSPYPFDEITADGMQYVKDTGYGLVYQCAHCKKYYLIVDYD